MSYYYFKVLLFIFFLTTNNLFSQFSISGNIEGVDGIAIDGASILLEPSHEATFTDENGDFSFENNNAGIYSITVYRLGYKTQYKEIEIVKESIVVDFQLIIDPLELDGIVVTGTFKEGTKLKSSNAITTLSEKDIQKRAARGTADLLQAIPGTFVDASAGEIFTRVYSRGISALAEDDIGWYYVSLQEDGLPITNYQTTYYGPDLFHRVDLTTRRLEAVRGGAASVTSSNAPGGIYNFISKTGGSELKSEVQLFGALQGEGNSLFRIDGNVGGPIGNNGLTFNFGGFYRKDDGPREINSDWANGGQIKFNLIKKHQKGYLKFYSKYLNDQVNRYNGLAATNWEDPQAAFGQDFNSSALMLPNLSTKIADGRTVRTNPNATFDYDPGNGVKTKDLVFGLDVLHEFDGDWVLRNNLKVSLKSADWQTTIANQPLGLESFTPYLLNGISPFFDVIPLGQVVFRDAQNGELVARVNNLGILNVFNGEAPEFEYLEGSLPNDALMGTAPWKKEDSATEIMEQLTLSKNFGNHDLTIGAFFASSEIESFTSGSFAYATYEPIPRMLRATLENPGEATIHLSDNAGISNYGGLLYRGGNARILNFSGFVNDTYDFAEDWSLNIGLRYEFINHNGEKDRSAPFITDDGGGIDGIFETAYDNSTLTATGEKDEFDFNYNYLSATTGLNYSLNTSTSIFGRFTVGHKAPELNYYFNNFEGIPIDKKGEIQDIYQAELGLKLSQEKFSLFSTLFWSLLDKVAFSEFVLDDMGGGIFFTPTQFNKTTTIGLELESVISIFKGFNLHIVGTLQDAKATDFTLYDAAGSFDDSDDQILDFSRNDLTHNPKLSFEVTPNWQAKQFNAFFTWRYIGERQGNIANAFQLPAFHLFNLGLGYQFNKSIYSNLIINNVFNSEGLMNFFGPNEFGSNSNAATSEFINNNPDASFVVFPVSPRTLRLLIGYKF